MYVNIRILGDFGGLCVPLSPRIQNYRSVTALDPSEPPLGAFKAYTRKVVKKPKSS